MQDFNRQRMTISFSFLDGATKDRKDVADMLRSVASEIEAGEDCTGVSGDCACPHVIDVEDI